MSLEMGGILCDAQQMAEHDPIAIGKRLRAARLAAGFETARQFAQAIGVEEKTYSTYERGTRGIPFAVLRLAALRLQVTSDYLLWGDVSGLPVRMYERLRTSGP